MAQVNSTTAPAPRITVIDPRTPERAKLRVAAYARVSSDSADQVNSYLAQVDYFTRYISGHEDWDMVDIYADEGISGLDAKKRDDFNRMMADCRDGKIDRVLCKSISRFARNTQDYICFMRELLRLGVTVYFEKENIDTGRMTSEQVADIYGAFAQMESTGHSNNMRLSVHMRMVKGLYTPSSAPYGYRLVENELVVYPEEAEVVQGIFHAYLNGRGPEDIAKELNQRGIVRPRGRETWYPSTIRYILTNSSYTGDMVWQKTFATDTIPFQQVRNRGQKQKYIAEDCHQAIISKEDFRLAQELAAARRERISPPPDQEPSRYRQKVFCGVCGAACRKKTINGRVYWLCRRHDSGKECCPTPEVPEGEIDSAVLRCYHKLKQNRGQILQPLLRNLQELRERELRSNRKLCDIDKEIAHLSEQNLVLVRLKSKGYVDPALYLSQQDEITHKLKEMRKLRRRILDASSEDQQVRDTEAILDYLEESPEWLDKAEAELFDALFQRISLLPAGQIKLRLRNGLELTEAVERAVS